MLRVEVKLGDTFLGVDFHVTCVVAKALAVDVQAGGIFVVLCDAITVDRILLRSHVHGLAVGQDDLHIVVFIAFQLQRVVVGDVAVHQVRAWCQCRLAAHQRGGCDIGACAILIDVESRDSPLGHQRDIAGHGAREVIVRAVERPSEECAAIHRRSSRHGGRPVFDHGLRIHSAAAVGVEGDGTGGSVCQLGVVVFTFAVVPLVAGGDTADGYGTVIPAEVGKCRHRGEHHCEQHHGRPFGKRCNRFLHTYLIFNVYFVAKVQRILLISVSCPINKC